MSHFIELLIYLFLQVLLSQVHRVRALDLLGKFLDLGPWAVNLVSCVRINVFYNVIIFQQCLLTYLELEFVTILSNILQSVLMNI